MRIGILTFQQAINYGAVLQLYALQKVLENLEYEVEVINYQSKKFEEDYKLNKLRYGFLSLFYTPIKLKKYKKFWAFSDKYLKLTKKIYSHNDMKDFCAKYDYVIVGSDQVWNYELTNSDSTYLLDFVPSNKRISYAASFGVSELPNELKCLYKKYLSEFKYITVREKQASLMLNELCGIKPQVVLDPTLLLPKCFWGGQLCAKSKKRNKFILTYCIGKSDLLKNFSEVLKKETGFDIVDLNPRGIHRYGKNSAVSAGIEEFIELFIDAEYVLTNSFHGTAFSINFNKKFVVDLGLNPNAIGNRNSRIINVLELFNLKDRIIHNINLEKLYEDWQYDVVNKKIEEERERSIEIIKDMIDRE